MNNEKVYIHRDKVYKKLDDITNRIKIAYIGCPAGWGKTLTVKNWLIERNLDYSYASADSENFFDEIYADEFENKSIIVLDDLSLIIDSNEQNAVADFIAKSPKKFILIARNTVPEYLKAFHTTRQLECIDELDLTFSRDEAESLLKAYDVQLNNKEFEKIAVDVNSYPLALSIMANLLKDGEYTEEIFNKAMLELWNYYDYAVFQRWSVEFQSFIMDMCIFDKFTPELASMVTGKSNPQGLLNYAEQVGSFLTFTPPDTYSFKYNMFIKYLKYKQKKLMSKEIINQLFQNAGLYFELKGRISDALYYYSIAGNTDKLSCLLIENANKHASNAEFYDTQEYYLSIPEEKISQSPELMSAISMLYSLKCQSDKSEMWYEKLKEFVDRAEKKDSRYKVARAKLLYLNIALPHRGSDNIKDLLVSTAKLCISGKFSLQEMSVTGNMPSILNGGKDFCDWLNDDRKLYATVKKPVEFILGKGGFGLGDIALGESLYEKNTDLNFIESVSLLNKGNIRVNLKGTEQMKFAEVGVMTKIYIAQNSIDTADELVKDFERKYFPQINKIFKQNVKALELLIDMYRGDNDSVSLWLARYAPNENVNFFILLKYCYVIKVKAYIMQEKYTEALALIEMLEVYFTEYKRTYFSMQIKILRAIVLFRIKNSEWESKLTEAIEDIRKYKLTRILCDEGIAILELLIKMKHSKSDDYFQTLLTLTRKQAVLYPKYLTAEKAFTGNLTETEKAVLSFAEQGMKNSEIGELLGMSLRTVKTHTTNIYTKLGVESRTQAIKVAHEKRLIK